MSLGDVEVALVPLGRSTYFTDMAHSPRAYLTYSMVSTRCDQIRSQWHTSEHRTSHITQRSSQCHPGGIITHSHRYVSGNRTNILEPTSVLAGHRISLRNFNVTLRLSAESSYDAVTSAIRVMARGTSFFKHVQRHILGGMV